MINEKVCLGCPGLRLVPYLSAHVPLYHTWMSDPGLMAATESEPLSLEEEFANQRAWMEALDKLTFIITARRDICTENNNNNNIGSTRVESFYDPNVEQKELNNNKDNNNIYNTNTESAGEEPTEAGPSKGRNRGSDASLPMEEKENRKNENESNPDDDEDEEVEQNDEQQSFFLPDDEVVWEMPAGSLRPLPARFIPSRRRPLFPELKSVQTNPTTTITTTKITTQELTSKLTGDGVGHEKEPPNRVQETTHGILAQNALQSISEGALVRSVEVKNKRSSQNTSQIRGEATSLTSEEFINKNHTPPTDLNSSFVPIGDTNLFWLGDEPGGARSFEVEVMIAAPGFRRRGLARRALRLVLQYARVVLGGTDFIAKILTENTPSVRLFQTKLHFQLRRWVPVFGEVHLGRRVRTLAAGRRWRQESFGEDGEGEGWCAPYPCIDPPEGEDADDGVAEMEKCIN